MLAAVTRRALLLLSLMEVHGIALHGQVSSAHGEPTDVERVRAAIVSRYVGARPKGIDTARSVDEILALLADPNTRRLTAAQFAAFVGETSGARHVGVGLQELLGLDYSVSGHDIVVISPEPSSPAKRAGLRTGDVITAVEDTPIDGTPLASVADLLRGPEGSSVKVSILRGSQRFDVLLTRSDIPPRGAMVSYTTPGDATRPSREITGCLRIGGFTSSTPDSVAAALANLSRHATRLVLDLRNNPGGDLAAARRVAGYFAGPVPIALSITSERTDTIRAIGPSTTHLPITIWVNRATASAAELLASGLRDAAGAEVEGEPTTGKGLVHSILGPLRDSSYVIFTVARLATLSGRELLANGIVPTRPIPETSPCR